MSCNTAQNFYPVYNDSNSYFECFNGEHIGFYFDTSNNIYYKCDNKCKSCSIESVETNKCISCNTYQNYYPKSDDSNPFKECYNGEQMGYYLDTTNNIYHKCDNKCNTCSL